jgi:hypothetical protein
MRAILVIAGAALLLGGCEVSVKRDGDAGAGGNAAAPETVRDGQIAIDTPGFDMKLDIPEALRSEIGGDGDLIYPGSKIGGLNISAGKEAAHGRGQVQMRFTTADAPDKVAAWYRDPARAAALTGVSVQQEGTGYRIRGADKNGSDPFDLRLSAAPGGGTQAELLLRDAG